MSDQANGANVQSATPEETVSRSPGKRKKKVVVTRDRTNPPYYLVIGNRKDTAAPEIVTEKSTIGRARKFRSEMAPFLASHYSHTVILRCKVVSPVSE